MEKIVFDYEKLGTRLVESGVSLSKLASYMGISASILEKKLDQGLPFKMKHIKSICTRLHIREEEIDSYFFVEKFDHNEHSYRTTAPG